MRDFSLHIEHIIRSRPIEKILVVTSATLSEETHLRGLCEINNSIVRVFNTSEIYFLARDGAFYSIDKIMKIVNNDYRQIIKFAYSYWYGSTFMAKDLFNIDNFCT